MSGDMSMMGRVVGVARVGDPSRELERVVARPELRVLRLQLREAPLELRDARAKRRDLRLAIGVALGVFGLLASAALDEVELSLAAAAEVHVLEYHRSESGARGGGAAARRRRDFFEVVHVEHAREGGPLGVPEALRADGLGLCGNQPVSYVRRQHRVDDSMACGA